MSYRVFVGGVFTLLAVLGSPACSPSLPGTPPPVTLPSPYCLPEPLHVNPPQIPAGSSVIVSSAGFNCGGSYPSGQQYRLELGLLGRQPPLELGSYPVNTNGSFEATVRIPENASAGEAAIIVYGSPFDQCTDSGQASCAGYGVTLTIIPSIQ